MSERSLDYLMARARRAQLLSTIEREQQLEREELAELPASWRAAYHLLGPHLTARIIARYHRRRRAASR